MINLYTPVSLPSGLPRLSHADRLLLMGSCFASEMGERLTKAKFCCDVNPYGVLYNPLSISAALREIADGSEYTPDRLFHFRECWHSPMHHGDFSSPRADEALCTINTRLRKAHAWLPRLDYLMLTFGTAWVYQSRETGQVVSNCHKLPEFHFTRRRLSVDEIVLDYQSLLAHLWSLNPRLKFLLTVSPIRHIRDGLHANNLSKATLLLAIDRLQTLFPDRLFYFPAYELLLDELRDYRFYADDLVHPSAVALRHVWEQFVHACLSPTALQIMEECEKISKSLYHKPFRPDSEEYKRFLGQIVLKIDQLSKKYPYLDFQKERELCLIRLKA